MDEYEMEVALAENEYMAHVIDRLGTALQNVLDSDELATDDLTFLTLRDVEMAESALLLAEPYMRNTRWVKT